MHLQLCRPARLRTTCTCATVPLLRTSLLGSSLAADVVARQRTLGPANLAETNGSISSLDGKEPRRAASVPLYRMILAVDVEGSTKRNNRGRDELRYEVYRLVGKAMRDTGIGRQHYHHPFTDRGDGFLVLLRPVDELPKPLLLSQRVVIHAGEVLCDGNGFFGEDLDLAFRLLEAPRFKKELQSATAPLALVASDYIYQSVIKHGYDGIDDQEFRPLTVNVGDQRRKGSVQLPRPAGISAVPAQARAAYAS